MRVMAYERSTHKLALSCGMGVYIAFSPFVGFHTAMVFLFSWIFALNFAVVLAVSMLLNNPWTMIPVYSAGHMFGDWVLQLFGINHMALNPSWIEGVNSWLSSHIGLSGISLWAFLLGGNVLGVVLGIVSYPLIKRYARIMRYTSKKQLAKSKKVAKKISKNL
jgi:Uncharacterized protein conserved in bacteria